MTFCLPPPLFFSALRPTYTHEALKWLVDANVVKHIMSQNCDGLHVLSGVPRSALSELHGKCSQPHRARVASKSQSGARC